MARISRRPRDGGLRSQAAVRPAHDYPHSHEETLDALRDPIRATLARRSKPLAELGVAPTRYGLLRRHDAGDRPRGSDRDARVHDFRAVAGYSGASRVKGAAPILSPLAINSTSCAVPSVLRAVSPSPHLSVTLASRARVIRGASGRPYAATPRRGSMCCEKARKSTSTNRRFRQRKAARGVLPSARFFI